MFAYRLPNGDCTRRAFEKAAVLLLQATHSGHKVDELFWSMTTLLFSPVLSVQALFMIITAAAAVAIIIRIVVFSGCTASNNIKRGSEVAWTVSVRTCVALRLMGLHTSAAASNVASAACSMMRFVELWSAGKYAISTGSAMVDEAATSLIRLVHGES